MKNDINVLVVEDNPIAQKVAEIILTGLGCSVKIAKDGEQALCLFKENEYRIIFMDIGLPGINGIDVTKEMRKIGNGVAHVPIIALTANYDESYKPSLLEAGMDDFMLKPLTKKNAAIMLGKFVKRDN